MDNAPEPQVGDSIMVNDNRTRISWIGSTADYAIHVDDGYDVDRGELTLIEARGGYGQVNTWRCRTGPDGRRY